MEFTNRQVSKSSQGSNSVEYMLLAVQIVHIAVVGLELFLRIKNNRA